MSCCHDEHGEQAEQVAKAVAPHPLDPVSAAEIDAVRTILEADGKVTETTRFPLVLLDEPARHTAAAHRDGDPVVRRVRVTLLDSATGRPPRPSSTSRPPPSWRTGSWTPTARASRR